MDGPALNAEFYEPYGIVSDTAGNLYVGDTFNGLVRKITKAGIVNTLSGNGQGFVNQPAVVATFANPLGLAMNSNGVLYVADGNLLKSIDPLGVIDTVAGLTAQGYVNGPAATAQFAAPAGLAFDKNGNLFIADTYNSVIRRLTPAGQVTTFAGNGIGGFVNSSVVNAEFLQPQAIVTDSAGNVFVGDYANARVRKINLDGSVTTVAGNSTHAYVDGNADTAEF